VVKLVSRPEDVSVQWMNEALSAAGCLDAAVVESLDFELIGTGKMGDNARFCLSYGGEAGSAPTTVVGKFPAADETARAMASAGGAYYNEVMFYRELAPRTSMRTPHIYVAELSEDNTEFMLLMEDLAPAEPGSAFVGESRERSLLVLEQIARLATAFYGEEGLGERDHVMSSARDDGGAFGQALLEQSWPGFLDRFGHGLSREAVELGERYVNGYKQFITAYDGPMTLAHGDLRSENLLFADGVVTTVDWQTPGESSPLTDAAYFLGGSLEVADRRLWEQELVSRYREFMAEYGVDLSQAECWSQYRRQSMHGIIITVLGASFSEPAERSDRMFLTMIQRHLQHCVDVQALEFLG
jgi:hypothetical protein